jgi:hypothetical protein
MKKFIIVVYNEKDSQAQTFHADTFQEADKILERERENRETTSIYVTEILRTFKRLGG